LCQRDQRTNIQVLTGENEALSSTSDHSTFNSQAKVLGNRRRRPKRPFAMRSVKLVA